MQKKRYAQRKHIILSLDTFLYQLHVLNYFMSPSLSILLSRALCEAQCSRPRYLDPTRTLRFFFGVVLFFNIPAFWSHANYGAAEGKTIILDFVGIAYVPFKMHLLIMDFIILFLQLVLTAISYETYTAQFGPPDTIDPLLPIPPTSSSTPSTPVPGPSTTIRRTQVNDDIDEDEVHIEDDVGATTPGANAENEYILDLRFSSILTRLRATESPPESTAPSLLPMSNTSASWSTNDTLRMLMALRERTRRQQRQGQGQAAAGTASDAERTNRLPGGIDVPRRAP